MLNFPVAALSVQKFIDISEFNNILIKLDNENIDFLKKNCQLEVLMDSKTLIEIRVRLSLSQQQLADRIGTGLRQYQKWEAGDAPIRAIVAQAVANIESLSDYERLAKQSKKLQAKCELYRVALGECVTNLARMGASAEKTDAMELCLAQGAIPDHKELSSAFMEIENPSVMTGLLKAMCLSIFDGLDGFPTDVDKMNAFIAAVTSMLSPFELEEFKNWSGRVYAQTSIDPIISAYKAISKVRYVR